MLDYKDFVLRDKGFPVLKGLILRTIYKSSEEKANKYNKKDYDREYMRKRRERDVMVLRKGF